MKHSLRHRIYVCEDPNKDYKGQDMNDSQEMNVPTQRRTPTCNKGQPLPSPDSSTESDPFLLLTLRWDWSFLPISHGSLSHEIGLSYHP